MAKSQYDVGDKVFQFNERHNFVYANGIVTGVTPTGRVTVAMEKPDGHTFEQVFDAKGYEYPRRSFIMSNGVLKPFSAGLNQDFRRQKQDHDKRMAQREAEQRKEQAEQKKDREAMVYVLGLIKDDNDPRAQRAAEVMARWGYKL